MTSTDLIKPDQFRALSIPDDQFAGALSALQEQEVGEFDLTRIKIPSGGGTTWEIPSIRGDQAVKRLECVVVFNKFTRAYWDRPYGGGNEPPTCASADGRHAQARPQHDEASGEESIPEIPAERDERGRLLCDTCSYAEFGTARTPEGKAKRGQACKQMRQLFVLLSDRLLPCVVTLPPTSLKPSKNYFLGLVDAGYQPHQVTTVLALEKTSGSGVPDYSVCTFRLGEELPAPAAARAKSYADAAKPRFSRVVATAADLPDDDGS